MGILRHLTAGESHGRGLAGIIEGIPAGLEIEAAYINAHLARRQLGYGRGGRMKIERDEAEILSGVRFGRTMGSPVSLLIWNRDWENWSGIMRVEPGKRPPPVTVPRPGHADYPGAVKYGHADLRDVLERASARETAMRVGLACFARKLLEDLDVHIASRVLAIGAVKDPESADRVPAAKLNTLADASPVRCLGKKAGEKMAAAIDAARRAGDTLGGVLEIRAEGLPAGLGSYSQWDRRLEGELAHALMSLNAVKGVEVGLGFEGAGLPGSGAHDAFFLSKDGTRRAVRRTNRSGGIDGGITTGEVLVMRAAMKPIPTLARPLRSIDMRTREAAAAHAERADVCAVPAAAVICESLAALVLAGAFLDKYGGDSMTELRAHYRASRRG